MKKEGKVWLVGAGTGEVGLLTQKAVEVLQSAEVIVYDALVSLEVLSTLPDTAEWIYVGKRSNNHSVSQEEINYMLLEKAQEGKQVVRLKGGDPFVFGRGGEELELLHQEGISFEMVPGITSSIAVPMYSGIPVTHREYASSFHVITGHKKKDGVLDIDFASLVKLDGTLVFLMGVSALGEICRNLLEAGMEPNMPAAFLERGTTYAQRRAVATVSTLKGQVEKDHMKSPAVIVVGKVCELERIFSWVEKKPLFGQQILVTRPRERASELGKRLRKLGAQVVEMPAIETIPIMKTEHEECKARWKEAIQCFCQETSKVCAVFTSPQGVKCFFEQLREMKIDMRDLLSNRQLSFGVIGNATKKALEEFHIFAEYMPKQYSAKALGVLLRTNLPMKTKIYLFRALEGSPQLVEELEEGHFAYEDIAVYETMYKGNLNLVEKVEEAFENGAITGVTFTSASTVKGFVSALPHVDCTRVNAFCIGEQTAAEAEKYHMNIAIAREATMDSMVELIERIGNKNEFSR